MASEMPEFADNFYNLEVVKDYLETWKSSIQWRDGAWQVAQDTFSINLACKLDQETGSFGAVAAANKIAIWTRWSQHHSHLKKVNGFTNTNGGDPSMVRGTGALRQFVPHTSRGNILDRPPLWAQKPFQSGSRMPALPRNGSSFARGPLTFGVTEF
jgi:hypothetical protein